MWGVSGRLGEEMYRLLPWQRQLCECEQLICQREAVLSEVRAREGTDLPLACLPSPALCGRNPPSSEPWAGNPDRLPQVTVWPAGSEVSLLQAFPTQPAPASAP